MAFLKMINLLATANLAWIKIGRSIATWIGPRWSGVPKKATCSTLRTTNLGKSMRTHLTQTKEIVTSSASGSFRKDFLLVPSLEKWQCGSEVMRTIQLPAKMLSTLSASGSPQRVNTKRFLGWQSARTKICLLWACRTTILDWSQSNQLG